MAVTPANDLSSRPWWHELNRYHWFVLIVAALGWLFDTLDQQLFNLARVSAMRDLLPHAPGMTPSPGDIAKYGGYATSIFLIGWASGGLMFGVLGDRIGRARTMLWTILIYSICTGLSALSTGFWDFAFYRFITGLGVGGEFAVGVALVAEVMPSRARPHALGLLQALSTVGNMSAAFITMGMGVYAQAHNIASSWRYVFVIGAVPAFLALLIRRRLKEPEDWQRAVASGEVKRTAGSYRELFSHPVLRKNCFIGLALAFSGVVGLWGIGFFSSDLTQSVLRKTFATQGGDAAKIPGMTSYWGAVTFVMLNIGAFFGMMTMTRACQRFGRRPSFAVAFVAAMLSTAFVFWNLKTFSDIFWMVPIMGFCQLSLFAGYAIYFPELFPTHLRSTGTSFCYNVGRFVAAAGPATLGLLTADVFRDKPEPMRWAGVTMCAVFLIGLAALPFAPETKGQPLPEADSFLH